MPSPLELLDEGIQAQQARMRGYEVESEALTLETVRSLDYVYFKDLIPELQELPNPVPQEVTIMQWGVNEALQRVLPRSLRSSMPRLPQSHATVQEQADTFIFDAGVLAMAKHQRALLAQRLLTGAVDPRCTRRESLILVLDAVDTSVYWDAIGRAGMAWISAQAMEQDRASEAELERRYIEILPQLQTYLANPHRWDENEPFEGSENYFYQCAQLYLRRIAYRDLLADDDVIGGHPYGRYVDALTVISAMCQMRLCCAGLICRNDPRVGIRNALTGGMLLTDLRGHLARLLNADEDEVTDLLKHLVLSPHNYLSHLASGTPAWAPVIRTSEHFCILPSYGLDINPFVFLLHELRTFHPDDWFRLANRREERWVGELETLFPPPRWKCTSGTKLKRGGKIVTDVDFVAYDCETRQLAVFQLKWQQPALADEKMSRSNGANLVETCNKWIKDVQDWLTEFGVAEFLNRSQLNSKIVDDVSYFVIARYSAHFPTNTAADPMAIWSDWGHLRKHRYISPNGSVLDLKNELRTDVKIQQLELKPMSFALPLPGLILVVNPTKRPMPAKVM